MGRTQPHGIAGQHGAALRFLVQPSLCFTQHAGPPAKAEPGPRNAEMAVPGRFAPNCGEGTISVGRCLGLAQDF